MSIQGLGQSFSSYQPMVSSGRQCTGSNAFEMPSANSVMANDDANGDGVLNISETPMSEEQFANADADSDGGLSTQELEEVFSNGPPPMMGGGPPPGGMGAMGGSGESELDALLAEEDTDEDGSISAEETSLDDEIFSSLDLNQDGLLSQEEILKGMGEHEARMSSMQGGEPNLTQATAAQTYQSVMESVMSSFSDDYKDSLLGNFIGAVG